MLTKDQNQVNSFLLTNLAAADLLMGVYLFIIAFKDTSWEGVYYNHHFAWRESYLCFTAGIIATISNEVSVFFITRNNFRSFDLHRLSIPFPKIVIEESDLYYGNRLVSWYHRCICTIV